MRPRPSLPAPLRRARNRLHFTFRRRGQESDIRALAWISVARSGSTYLCDLLKSQPEIEPYPEIFHPRCVFTHDFAPLAALLRDRHGHAYEHPRDPSLIRWVHEHPAEFLADLQSAAAGRRVSFKIFPGHLPPADVRRVILADRGVAKIIFRRDPLNTFISREKALHQQRWEFADTSGLKIDADPVRFAAYVQGVERWFASVRNYLRDTGQPYLEMSYEELMQRPDDAARLRWVARRLGETFPGLAHLSNAGELAAPVARRKQDAARSLADRINNYDEFVRGLRERGLARFIETGALALPWLAAL